MTKATTASVGGSSHRVAKNENERGLLQACAEGDVPGATLLLELGTSALVVDELGVSPALAAASGGHAGVHSHVLRCLICKLSSRSADACAEG